MTPDRDRLTAESHLELDERVRRRAHEIWLSHKDRDSSDTALEDWLQAEREVLGRSNQPAQDRGTTVGDAHRPVRDRIRRAGS